jgi:DNA-directed RNA polymerase specialized sigma24 family protein
MPLAPVENAFDLHLREIATIVWRKTRRVQRTVYGVLGEGVNERECKHYADVAAFLAFKDCGGDPAAPQDFDWVENRTKLIKQAHHHLLQLFRRGDQTYDVDRVPLKRRTEIVVNDQYCWDIWRQPVSGRSQRGGYNEEGEDVGDTRRRHEYDPEPEQERQLVEGMLRELGRVLANALSDSDFDLLDRHYFRGQPQREIAAELGLRENALNVRMTRVRERARKALEAASPEWRELFNDLV